MKAKCDNCGKRIDESKSGIEQIDDLCQRLTPGGEVPAGQCPYCGALTYLDPPKAKSLKAAIGRIRDALACYCEDCISGDPKAKARIEADWRRVREAADAAAREETWKE